MADAVWQRIARSIRRGLYRYLAAEVVATVRDITAEQAAALRAELAAAFRAELLAERDRARERFAALDTAMQDLRRDLDDDAALNARLTAIEIHIRAVRAQITAEASAADARLAEIERAAAALFERFESQGEALGERMTRLELLPGRNRTE
jgi:ribosome-associated translation inhibitor RaiA